ncbi:hypothetical protein LTR17_027032 [Elasticomyces elasticus]|nr:hypothetical protein LTR17_027032 [Elasticomyces elasticus]
MALLFSIPHELLQEAVLRLDKVALKRLRCVSRDCARLVTPLLFREVVFDLESGGCDRLVAIAGHPDLRLLPRSLRFTRRRGLKGFQSIEAWQKATVYVYNSLVPQDEAESILPQMMTQSEWAGLGDTTRWRLYREYVAEQQGTYAYVSAFALSIAMRRGLVVKHDAVYSNIDSSRHHGKVDAFLNALDRLTAVTTFTHTAAHEWDVAWGLTWRRVQFHSQGLFGWGNDEYDADCDAVQLFTALSAVSSASNSLTSSTFFTRGYAFWGLPSLHRLTHQATGMEVDGNYWFSSLSTDDDEFTHDDPSLFAEIREIGGPLAFMQRTESLTRQLVAWERSFSRLTSLICRVDTGWLERSNERLIAATGLSNGLQYATAVEDLRLVFRPDAITDEPPWYIRPDGLDQLPSPDKAGLTESEQISLRIFGAMLPICANLRSLHLSLETSASDLLGLFARLSSLRHLELYYVILLTGNGHWEAILEGAAEQLHLERVGLRSLVDFNGTQSRCILHPDTPAFKAEGGNGNLYKEYEEAIVHFVLRRSDSLPHLTSEEYLRFAQSS